MYHLRLFGMLELRCGDATILNGCSRPLQLLTIVGLQRRPKSDEYLCSLLWPAAKLDARKHSLSQAIYTLNRSAPGIVLHKQGLVTVSSSLTTDLDHVREAIQENNLAKVLSVLRGPLIPETDQAGVSFSHWVDAVRAEHVRPIIAYIRNAFRGLLKDAQWDTLTRRYDELNATLARDPVLLEYVIRSLIYTSDAPSLKRDLAEKLQLCHRIDKDRATRLRSLLDRRMRWDARAKLNPGPFVGRAELVREFSFQLRQTPAGSGSLTCISGPIGIGRTRTAKQFARLAAIRGSRVRLVRLVAAQSHVNYARIVRALLELGGSTHPRNYRDVSILELAHRLPSTHGVPPLLVVDDLDWGDQSCIEMLCTLVGMLSRVRLSIIVTAKDTNIVRRITAEVPRGVHWTRMQLGCLTPDERTQLLEWLRDRYELSNSEVILVDQLSSGNPHYAHACARRIRAKQDNSSLHATLGSELVEGLYNISPLCQRILALAAFARGRVDVRALAKTVQVPRQRLLAAVEWLTDLGALKCDSRNSVECADKFVCEAVSDRFKDGDLRLLIVRLERYTARFSRVDAGRLAEFAGDSESAARHYLVAGRQATSFGADSDAANLLRRALDLARDPRSQARIVFWRAELHLACRRYVEAEADYSSLAYNPRHLGSTLAAVCRARRAQLLAMLDPDNASMSVSVAAAIDVSSLRSHAPKAAAEVLLASSAIAIVSGSSAHATETIAKIQAELDSSPENPRWLELAAALCKLQLVTQGYTSALPLSRKYLARARICGTAMDLATSLLNQAIILTSSGELTVAEELYREVQKFVATHGLLGFSHILALNYSVALMEMGDTDAALDRLNALRAYDNSVSVGYYVAFDDLNLATAHFEQGNYDAAEFFAHEAVRRAETFPKREYVAALAMLGLIAWRRGDRRKAIDIANDARLSTQSGGDLSYVAIFKATCMCNQADAQAGINWLLDEATRLEVIYKPAALRLKVAAAEIQAAEDLDSAKDLALRCAREAAASGMYGLISRCAAVLARVAP